VEAVAVEMTRVIMVMVTIPVITEILVAQEAAVAQQTKLRAA
jgi:uncharacterized membrane protein AbrB (regulator of aidB expression)